MAFKRKIDVDADDVLPLVHTPVLLDLSHMFTPSLFQKAKQPKLIPFPNLDSDDDVPMSDAEPFYPELYHSRSPSNVSSTSSNASESSLGNPRMSLFLSRTRRATHCCSLKIAAYPAFDIYPMSSGNLISLNDYTTQPLATPPIGLLQPSSSFAHHGQVDDIEVYLSYIDILHPVLSATVVLKSLNFVSHAPRDSMANVLCGASANNVAPFPW